MYNFACMCGESKKNFKFDIGGPFRGECCVKAKMNKEELEKGNNENKDDKDTNSTKVDKKEMEKDNNDD